MNRAASGSLASTSGRSYARTPLGFGWFRSTSHASESPHRQGPARHRPRQYAYGALPEDVSPAAAERRGVLVHEPITLSIGGMDASDTFDVLSPHPQQSPASFQQPERSSRPDRSLPEEAVSLGSSTSWRYSVEMGDRKHQIIQQILHTPTVRMLHTLMCGLDPCELDSARIKCALLRLSQLCLQPVKREHSLSRSTPGHESSLLSQSSDPASGQDPSPGLSSSSIHSSSQHASPSSTSTPQSDRGLAKSLLLSLVHHVPYQAASMDIRTIATISSSLAKLDYYDVDLLQLLMVTTWSKMHEMTPNAAASLMWAYHRFQEDHGFPVSKEWTDRMLDVFVSHLDSCNPVDLSMAVTTIAHLPAGQRPSPHWLAAVASYVAQNIESFSAEQLSRVLHSVASLGMQPTKEWMGTVLRRVSKDARSLQTATTLNSLLHSLIVLRRRPQGVWMKVIMWQVQHRLSTFSSSDLSSLAWNLAKMQYRPHDAFLVAFERLFLRRHMAMPPGKDKAKVHATVLWALATLQIKPRKDWLQKISTELRPLLQFMAPKEFVMVLWAMQRMGIVPRGALMDDLLSTLNSYISLLTSKQSLITLLALSRYVRGKKARQTMKIDASVFSSLCARLSPAVIRSQQPLTFYPGPHRSFDEYDLPRRSFDEYDLRSAKSSRIESSTSTSTSNGSGSHNGNGSIRSGSVHQDVSRTSPVSTANSGGAETRAETRAGDLSSQDSSNREARGQLNGSLDRDRLDRVGAEQEVVSSASAIPQGPYSRLRWVRDSRSIGKEGVLEERLHPCEIKSVLVAVARLREPLNQAFHEDLLMAVSANLKALTPRQLAGSLTALCYLAHSTGRHMHMREDLALLPRLVAAMTPHLGTLDFLCLTLLAKGLAVMRYAPSTQWLSVHESSCVRLVESGTVAADQVAMLAKAYQRLKYDAVALKVCVFERILADKRLSARAQAAGGAPSNRQAPNTAGAPATASMGHAKAGGMASEQQHPSELFTSGCEDSVSNEYLVSVGEAQSPSTTYEL